MTQCIRTTGNSSIANEFHTRRRKPELPNVVLTIPERGSKKRRERQMVKGRKSREWNVRGKKKEGRTPQRKRKKGKTTVAGMDFSERTRCSRNSHKHRGPLFRLGFTVQLTFCQLLLRVWRFIGLAAALPRTFCNYSSSSYARPT